MSESRPEHDTATNRHTGAHLDVARDTIRLMCDTNPGSIANSAALAHTLPDISKAIVTIVLAESEVERYSHTPDSDTKPDAKPGAIEWRVLRRRLPSGQTFVAHPATDRGVSLSVSREDENEDRRIVRIITVPYGWQTAELFGATAAPWRDSQIYYSDLCAKPADIIYPFVGNAADPTRAQQYFKALQVMSALLLGEESTR